MIGFVLAEILYRRGRTLALMVGIAVATASFAVLTGVSETSRLETRGLVAKEFRVGYDLLVRPKGSQQQLEREGGLVQRNFQSGIYGGITVAHLRRIRAIPGVDVAAPLAMSGYLYPTVEIPIRLKGDLNASARTAFSVSTVWRSDGGMTVIRDDPSYVYATRAAVTPYRGPISGIYPSAFEQGRPICPKQRYDYLTGAQSPFEKGARTTRALLVHAHRAQW